MEKADIMHIGFFIARRMIGGGMLTIAICDDDEWMLRYMQGLVRRESGAQADLYRSGEELLAAGKEYDLLFLDICLDASGGEEGIDGMEAARRIRDRFHPLIVFVTAVPDYVYDAYDVEAFHYLLKPLDEDKFCDVLRRAAARREQSLAEALRREEKERPALVIKVGGSYLSVPKEDIYYAENDGRKVVLHTKGGAYSYYEKMEALERKLGNGFFRSHRGYLVSLSEVAGYDRTGIALKCGDAVFLAKKKYNGFVAAYMEYLAGQDGGRSGA